jgi:hypothetical protein
MYTCGLASSRHGWMAMPMTPVISPPVRKLIRAGTTLEKSYDGLTVLAATLTDKVATRMANSANAITTGLRNFAVSSIGSQIGVP